MMWPEGARKWSFEEIEADVALAREEFRKRRFGETIDQYIAAFDALEECNRRLISQLPLLLQDPVDPALVAEILKDQGLQTALRYLGAPPVSFDDLKTLTDSTLAWTSVQKDKALATSLRDVIAGILDPKRFPWVKEGRKPKPVELEAAILASTVAASAQQVQTYRRTEERNALEGAVRRIFQEFGMEPVPTRRIESLRKDAPKPGQFTERSCVLGKDDADIIVGLYDHRIMTIECKGSNSEINSRKRINKEVAQNASAWHRKYGEGEVVVAAAIQGVFKPAYIEETQSKGIVFFWGHRLEDLRDFIESTRSHG